MIKVEFDCKEEDFEFICGELEKLAGPDGVNLKPKKAYRNYCGFYSGDIFQTSRYNEVMKIFSDKGLVKYFMVGHINLQK